MQFIPLLCENLKGERLVELLELWDCDVIYDYDRLNENSPDVYWASAHDEGVLFKFNEHQDLTTIFLHVEGNDEYASIDLADTDIPNFDFIEAAEKYALDNGIATSSGGADFLSSATEWIRLEFDSFSIHFEFRDKALYLATISIR